MVSSVLRQSLKRAQKEEFPHRHPVHFILTRLLVKAHTGGGAFCLVENTEYTVACILYVV